jgi:hypothetical protein
MNKIAKLVRLASVLCFWRSNEDKGAANVQPAYAKASAWRALTCLAVAKAKEERPTLNSKRMKQKETKRTKVVRGIVDFAIFC